MGERGTPTENTWGQVEELSIAAQLLKEVFSPGLVYMVDNSYEGMLFDMSSTCGSTNYSLRLVRSRHFLDSVRT